MTLSTLAAIVTSALFRLALILGALALLVRLKVKIGRVLVAAPVIAGILFWSRDLPGRFAGKVTEEGGAFFFETATLIGLIGLIDIFGWVLKETERLPRLMRALQALFTDQRIALGGMPAVIGLLPMPGGAMVSAPVVEEMAQASGGEVSAENKVLVNYWFRHMWEYIFPVYPAVVVAASTWEVDLAELASRQAVLTLAALAAGFALVLTRVKPMLAKGPGAASTTEARRHGGEAKQTAEPNRKKSSSVPPPPAGKLRALPAFGGLRGGFAATVGHVAAIAKGLAPIAAVLGIWFALRTLGPAPAGYAIVDWKPWSKTSVLIALVMVILALAVIGRLRARWFLARLRHCMPLDMFLMIIGVMTFEKVVESSGAVEGVAAELHGAPLAVVIFLLPFVAGLLTGIAFAYVKIAFPLLAGLVMVGGTADPAATVLAYAAGYMGVLLSPVHICLVLTREYFGANLGTVYKRLLPPVAAVLAVAFTVYFTLTRL